MSVPQTKVDVIRYLASFYQIRVVVIPKFEDGRTHHEYAPDEHDMEMLSLLIGRKLTRADVQLFTPYANQTDELYLYPVSPHRFWFLRQSVLSEIS